MTKLIDAITCNLFSAVGLQKLFFILNILHAPLVFAQGFAGFEVDWNRVEEAYTVASEVIESYQLPLELPPLEELGSALHWIERSLKEGSIEDLARLAPYTREAYAEIQRHPRFRPYGAWLEQRLDYFAVAETFLRAPPPAPRPPHAPAPPARSATPLHRSVEDAAGWQAKAKARPAPANAEQLVRRLKPVFVAEGVPPEWVWLAEVESSFRADARSPVGAVGLYQFMPRTAEHLGLKLTPQDERMHPEKSARAAARYLKYLYQRFQDWQLALAAYNAGEGRVAGLLRRHGDSFAAISPHLPTETRMYVPKVLAVVSERENKDARLLPAPK